MNNQRGPCANCGQPYARGHKWIAARAGECKVPRPGQKSFYAEPRTVTASSGKVGA